MDDLSTDTDTIDTDKKADDPGIGTNTLDINNTDRDANNPGKSIDTVDADVDKKADPGISTNTADIDGGADPGIDIDKADADADTYERANNLGTGNVDVDKQAAASNKTHISLFSLHKAFFGFFF